MPYSDPIIRTSYNKKYLKAHYQKNKEYYLDKKKKYIKKTLLLVNKYKDKPCLDCHIKYPSYVMDFHHREGERKENTIAIMIRQGYSFKRILEEIKKCDLICANCHRIRTHKK